MLSVKQHSKAIIKVTQKFTLSPALVLLLLPLRRRTSVSKQAHCPAAPGNHPSYLHWCLTGSRPSPALPCPQAKRVQAGSVRFQTAQHAAEHARGRSRGERTLMHARCAARTTAAGAAGAVGGSLFDLLSS